ncbi:pentapeptide repeat-containing protein [Pseudopelagicola sp. nBUS_19]|uniref:pentapeptide repeat-containing protein n=1 Tax=Pseudopelagicola sp. nBUS_19 TaxID=3395316 RepID=UPI003EB8A54B
MKRTLTALTVAATMFASSASAFDPDDLQKLKDTGDCVNCDLEGADLMIANLTGANLGGANLGGAYLAGANLIAAILTDAYLIGANMNGANLKAADLEGADLFRTKMNGATLCNTTMPDGSVFYSGC